MYREGQINSAQIKENYGHMPIINLQWKMEGINIK